MKTLVYFASGRYKEKYQELPFDRIYLIDYCYGHRIIHYGKVTCMGRDCLTSIRQLKIKKVKIDYFIAVNEGLFEGGGKYPINSDMFLGYVMPLLNDKYYHIMDKEYYGNNTYHVSMDLPFKQVEINEHDVNYLSPYLFSENSRRRGTSKVFRMEKNRTETKLILNDRLRINVIHDSIWVDYDNLELVALSITEQGQGDFFKKIPKAILINETPFSEILDYCVNNKISKIGFTPWMRGKYQTVIEELKNYKAEYPKEINFYHLNKKDYRDFKKN